MRKSVLYILLLTVFFIACENNANKDESKISESTEIESNNVSQKQEKPIFYADIDTKKQHSSQLLNIDNEEYRLNIDRYCLNDSSIKHEISIENNVDQKLIPAFQVYHNYEAEIGLSNGEQDTIIKKKIKKEIFKDSLSEAFYQESTILNVKYESVRSNRIYFNVILSAPDTDWQEEFTCAIFFRTDKISQLDYWKKGVQND